MPLSPLFGMSALFLKTREEMGTTRVTMAGVEGQKFMCPGINEP